MKKALIALAVVALLAVSAQAGEIKSHEWPCAFVSLEITSIPVVMDVGYWVKIKDQDKLKIKLVQDEADIHKFKGCVDMVVECNFNAIFRFKGDPENLGDNFLAAIRSKAVHPGEMSEVITLKSNFGVEGKTLDSFKDNVLWKPTEVKIFARSKGSQFVLLGEWDISRTIDFIEPAPVDIKKEEPAKTE